MLAARWNHPPNWPSPPAGWTPPPGWYPPPYWPPPPPGWQLWLPIVIEEPTPAVDERRGISGPNIIIALGAGLVALSAALPWINVVLLGSLNLFNLYQVQEKNPVIPEIVVAAALALAQVPAGAWWRFWSAPSEAPSAAYSPSMSSTPSANPTGLVTMSLGPLVAGAGVLVMTIAAITSMSRGAYYQPTHAAGIAGVSCGGWNGQRVRADSVPDCCENASRCSAVMKASWVAGSWR